MPTTTTEKVDAVALARASDVPTLMLNLRLTAQLALHNPNNDHYGANYRAILGEVEQRLTDHANGAHQR